MAGFNPFIDPATQAQIDRQRQLALMLQQSSMQPNEGQMVSGHYIAPALTQNLAKLLQGYSAQKMQAKSDVQQSDLWKNQMAGSQAAFGINGTGQPPADAPDAQAMGAGAQAAPNDAQNNNMGGVGPTPQNAALANALRAQTPQPAQPAPQNKALLDGYSPQASWMLSMTNPELYQTLLKQQLLNQAPTELQKNSNYMGIAPQENAEATRRELAAKGQQELKPGGTLTRTVMINGVPTVVPMFTAADNGIQTNYDPSGRAYAAAVPGYSDALAGNTKATEGAKAGLDLVTVNMPDGSSQQMPRSDAIQATTPGQTQSINNPGNLRPAGASTGFQQFASPAEGLAAIDKNLQSYGKQGANTVSSIISKWAPPSENNTQAYIADVSQRLGIKPDQKLDMTNPVVRQALSTAIAIHENGSNKLFASQADAGAPGLGYKPSAAKLAQDQAIATSTAESAVSAAKVKAAADPLLAQIADARKLVNQLPYGATAGVEDWAANQRLIGNPKTSAAIAQWEKIMGNFTMNGIASSGLGRMDIPIVNAINKASQVGLEDSPAAKLAALDTIEASLKRHVASTGNVVSNLNQPGITSNQTQAPMAAQSTASAPAPSGWSIKKVN